MRDLDFFKDEDIFICICSMIRRIQREALVEIEASHEGIAAGYAETDRSMQQLRQALSTQQSLHFQLQSQINEIQQDHQDQRASLQVDVAEIARSLHELRSSVPDNIAQTNAMLAELHNQVDYLQTQVNFSTEDVKRKIGLLQSNYAAVDVQVDYS